MCFVSQGQPSAKPRYRRDAVILMVIRCDDQSGYLMTGYEYVNMHILQCTCHYLDNFQDSTFIFHPYLRRINESEHYFVILLS